jgi:hypothetical protein
MPQQAQLAATQLVDEDDPWPGLEEWLNWSDAKRARIAKRVERDPAYDAWDALDTWEADRSLLHWALTNTPATSLRSLQVKARAVQACFGAPAPEAVVILSAQRAPATKLAEEIVRDLLTMEKAA